MHDPSHNGKSGVNIVLMIWDWSQIRITLQLYPYYSTCNTHTYSLPNINPTTVYKVSKLEVNQKITQVSFNWDHAWPF